jgi:hypothetical protein
MLQSPLPVTVPSHSNDLRRNDLHRNHLRHNHLRRAAYLSCLAVMYHSAADW